MSSVGSESWYWCFDHGRPEPEGEQCPAEDRLGPYGSRQEALNWRQKAEARNERWKEQDRKWEGEDEDWATET